MLDFDLYNPLHVVFGQNHKKHKKHKKQGITALSETKYLGLDVVRKILKSAK